MRGAATPGMAGVGSLVQWPLTTERCTLPVVGAGRRLRRPDPVRRPGCRSGRGHGRHPVPHGPGDGHRAPGLRQTVIDARETDTVLTQTSIRNALRSLKTQGALDIIAFEQHHPTFDELYPLIRGTVTKAAYEQDEPQAARSP